MRVVTISNRKGGTGKTATAVNLAAEAAAAGLRTLVVDLDTQGHAGLGFDTRAGRGEATVHDLFREPGFDLAKAIRPTPSERVWLAPADALFDGSALERRPSALGRQLQRETIAGRFDLVVIDTPPAYDILLVNALAASDGVIVPTLPQALSADGVRQFARVFFHVATTLNPGVRLLGLLPVMIGANPRHHRSTIGELTREFGAERMLDGIRSDVRVSEAFAARRPLRDHAPGSRAAEDYGRLLAQLVARETIVLPAAEGQADTLDRASR